MAAPTGMLVVMYVGAAVADASVDQKRRLREEMMPVLRDEKIPPRAAMIAAVKMTQGIMGDDWEPQGEWDEIISGLLDGK